MRQRHFYTLGFLLVLLAAAAGVLIVRQAVGPVAVPRLDVLTTAPEALGDLDLLSLLPRTNATRLDSESSTLEPTVLSQPVVGPAATTPAIATPTGDVESPAPDATPSPAEPLATAGPPTPTPAPPTPTPTAAPVVQNVQLAFTSAGPVQNSSDNCPGPSIRGVVRDASGNPLAAVRLWRYDQWGNEQVVETKSGLADLGQYDFPLGDTANVHYIQVVDAAGVVVSDVVTVQHRQGDAADAACHWVDWLRR